MFIQGDSINSTCCFSLRPCIKKCKITKNWVEYGAYGNDYQNFLKKAHYMHIYPNKVK